VTAGEAHRLARQQAAQPRQVDRGHGGDLGIAAHGLAVGQQHDRQAGARHLDGAGPDAVGDDVGATLVDADGVLDRRALEANAHAIGLLGDAVVGLREGAAAARAEMVVLRPPDDADRPAAIVEGLAKLLLAAGRRLIAGERHAIALRALPALKPPTPAPR
jgi:hypothetical protein